MRAQTLRVLQKGKASGQKFVSASSRNKQAGSLRSPIRGILECAVRLVDDLETHLSRGAGNDFEAGFVVA